MGVRLGRCGFNNLVQEAEAARAERLASEGLQRLGWSEAGLRARRKGEPRKVELARQSRAQTTAWNKSATRLASSPFICACDRGGHRLPHSA